MACIRHMLLTALMLLEVVEASKVLVAWSADQLGCWNGGGGEAT